ncbi:MAG: hypothetical protein H8Z69_03005 [Nanohaloarchaea archaeon]|nr:hypothetical protein [Candidatus Nanohaloarchaea archaeon]
MVILISSFMAVLNSIKVESFDPATNNASSTIEDFGRDKFIEIGRDTTLNDGNGEIKDDSQFAKRQFEGLLVWNMLAASDCMLLHIIENNNPELHLKHLRDNKETGYVEFFGWSELKKADFDMTCAQAGSIGFEVNRQSPTTIITMDAKRAAQPGKDMEGNFGKTRFNISKSFSIDSLGDDGILLGLKTKFEEAGALDAAFGELEVFDSGPDSANMPDFWAGQRVSVLRPPSLDPMNYGDLYNRHMYMIHPSTDNNNKEDRAGYLHFGSQFNDFGYTNDPVAYKFSAWRPSVHDGTWVFANGRSPHKIKKDLSVGDGERTGRKVLINSIKNGEWVFCKGMEGYVISKAQRFSNLGEASSNNPKKEDTVLPKIQITEPGNGTNCQEGGPDGFNEFVGHQSKINRNGVEFSCSRLQAANKKITDKEALKTEIGKQDGEMQYLTYGCGLTQHTFDFNDFEWSGVTVTVSETGQGSTRETRAGQHYQGAMTYYTPGMWKSCPSGYENYEILSLKDNLGENGYKELGGGDNSISFGNDQFSNIQGVEIIYEKRDGAELELDIGGQTISVESSGSNSPGKLSIGSNTDELDVSYETGVYMLDLVSFDGIAGGDGSNSASLIEEGGEGQGIGAMGADYNNIESFDITKQGSGEIILREVRVDAKPTEC